MRSQPPDLSTKTSRILNGVLIALLLVLFRVWHLSVVQHDQKVCEASKPQQRTVVTRPPRATICDRFGIPLAENKVQYDASLCYAPIREVPRWEWRKEGGKKVKIPKRRQYITELSHLLAEELQLDPVRVEDLIHAKAAILGNVPLTLKENISEKSYFRLMMLEKDWPGICAEIVPKRHYPLGRCACDIVGYIGPISQAQYRKIIEELRTLRACVSQWEEGIRPSLPEGYLSVDEVIVRLDELEKRAYRINDRVGKAGVEASFDEVMRGLRGKRTYLADVRGNFLRELPDAEEVVSGSRVELTLSAELQRYAEEVLADFEEKHREKTRYKEYLPENALWMKGGAIVAMEPKSGEVLALASFPRFDPNDFVPGGSSEEREQKNQRIHRWLENETQLQMIWDGQLPWQRERYNGTFYDESIEMSWENFLASVLPQMSNVRQVIEQRGTLADALCVQNNVEELLALFDLPAAKVFDFVFKRGMHKPIGVQIELQEKEWLKKRVKEVAPQMAQLKGALEPYFHSLFRNDEKLLLLDLYRVAVDHTLFDERLATLFGKVRIEEHRKMSRHLCNLQVGLRALCKDLFHEEQFTAWRKLFFKEYLAKKRAEEEAQGRRWARPYIDFLDEKRREMFGHFWGARKWDFLSYLLQDKGISYFDALGQWSEELKEGAHSGLVWRRDYLALREMADEIDPSVFVPYLQTMRSFSQLDRPLLGRHSGLRGNKERDLASAFYAKYGYGCARSFAYRQATTIGSLFKVVGAYESLRQRYVKLEQQGAHVWNLNPLTIVDDRHSDHVGYFAGGRPIPMFYHGGRMIHSNHSGIGRVDLVGALAASSNPYFSLIAGEVLEDPEDLGKAAASFGFGEKSGIDLPGEFAGKISGDTAYNRSGLYSMAIGQHTLMVTPLQTAVMLGGIATKGEIVKPKITLGVPKEKRWEIFMPGAVHDMLMRGLSQVIRGERGNARSLPRLAPKSIVNQMVGKTSTAEVVERVSLDPEHGALKMHHIWFGAISYKDEKLLDPELVVVVYLRQGRWGNQAAPLAAKIIEKWRDLASNLQDR